MLKHSRMFTKCCGLLNFSYSHNDLVFLFKNFLELNDLLEVSG